MNSAASTDLNLEATPMNWGLPTIQVMDTMGKRLQHALELRRKTPAALNKQLGGAKGTVYNILNENTTVGKVTFETVWKICAALHIEPEWLVYGEGRAPGEASAPLALPAPSQPVTEDDAPDVASMESMQTVTQALVDLALRRIPDAASLLLADLSSDTREQDILHKDPWASDILGQLREAVRAASGKPPSAHDA
jgi:transcriptional regulator with XRE-family HTH domain